MHTYTYTHIHTNTFPDEAVCIAHSTNTLGKGMNPTILTSAMGKIVGQIELFSLGMATGLGKGKLC